MNESFLHYIWQFQYFDKKDLRTSTGEQITVLNPGLKNMHAGPDFYNAQLKLDTIEWAGSVEMSCCMSCGKKMKPSSAKTAR
jgi:hypothetical protein